MSNGLKIVILMSSVIVVCIITVVAFQFTKDGKRRAEKTTCELHQMIKYEELKEFDGKKITGLNVIELIKTHENHQLYMLVKTRECEASQGVYYNYNDSMEIAGTYNRAQDRVSKDYINEYAQFECSVKENQNGIVIGISFVQQ